MVQRGGGIGVWTGSIIWREDEFIYKTNATEMFLARK